jgi:hypothetical protein
MFECVIDVKFWSNVIIGTIVLFFAGWFLAWLKHQWLCRNDRIGPITIDTDGFRFDHMFYRMNAGKKEMHVLLINDETNERIVYLSSNGEILKEYYRFNPENRLRPIFEECTIL